MTKRWTGSWSKKKMQFLCESCGIRCGLMEQPAAIWWFTDGRRGEWLCQRCSDKLEDKLWFENHVSDIEDVVGGDAYKPRGDNRIVVSQRNVRMNP